MNSGSEYNDYASYKTVPKKHDTRVKNQLVNNLNLKTKFKNLVDQNNRTDSVTAQNEGG